MVHKCFFLLSELDHVCFTPVSPLSQRPGTDHELTFVPDTQYQEENDESHDEEAKLLQPAHIGGIEQMEGGTLSLVLGLAGATSGSGDDNREKTGEESKDPVGDGDADGREAGKVDDKVDVHVWGALNGRAEC